VFLVEHQVANFIGNITAINLSIVQAIKIMFEYISAMCATYRGILQLTEVGLLNFDQTRYIHLDKTVIKSALPSASIYISDAWNGFMFAAIRIVREFVIIPGIFAT
jgi:hypothetical protein